MKPFFSYYGAKYTGSKYYGPPRAPVVIEPFAGSACYSTRWNAPLAKLYDVSPDICALWDWLIHCSLDDVRALPDEFENFDQVAALAHGPRTLAQFWVSKGRAEPSGKLSPWYFQYRNARDCRVWGAAVKRRIIEQKPLIAAWTIEQRSYADVPLVPAHWHVDPPYDNAAGSRYPYSRVDFAHLGAWCRSLPGEVDVCENVGAKWLPFEPLYTVVSTRGRRSGAYSQEAVWRKHVSSHDRPCLPHVASLSLPD